MINADDLENWTKGQWGLQSNGGDWVSFHRNHGDDRVENGVAYSNHGTSEVVMRSQFAAWSRVHAGEVRAWRDAFQSDPERRAGHEAPARAGRGDRRRDREGARPARSAIEPTHSPRTPRQGAASVPRRGCCSRRRGADLQREVEQLLYRQAELLDAKHWQAWIDLFADDGVYWMPVARRADRVGGLAVDLRRRQADDGDPQGPRHASQCLVAGAAVGDQPPRQPRRDRSSRARTASSCARAST